MIKFLESPANRTGLAIWLGTVVTAVVQYFVLHQAVPSADLLGIVLGLVKIVQPENSVTVAQLETAIADLSAALTTKNAAAIGAVVADAEGIVAGVAGEASKS